MVRKSHLMFPLALKRSLLTIYCLCSLSQSRAQAMLCIWDKPVPMGLPHCLLCVWWVYFVCGLCVFVFSCLWHLESSCDKPMHWSAGDVCTGWSKVPYAGCSYSEWACAGSLMEDFAVLLFVSRCLKPLTRSVVLNIGFLLGSSLFSVSNWRQRSVMV